MQAIILAAGLGKRLGNLTLNNTKCMVKVNGVPLIERMLLQLDALHLEKIILVIGYEGEKLRLFADSLPLKTRLEYVTNEVYDKTNNIYSLYLAKDYMLASDILLLEADLVFEEAMLTKLVNNPYPDLALVDKFESWMDGTCVTIDSDNNILRFIPKKVFSFDERSEYYKTVNIYKFSRQFLTEQYVPFLEAYMKASGLNDYYEQVLRVISSLDNAMLKALPLDGEKWYEIDNLEDLDIAEAMMAKGSLQIDKISYRKGGYWRFPSVADFTQSANPSFPGRKMFSEIKANSEVLIRNNPSGPEVINLLAAKYFNVESSYISVASSSDQLLRILLSNIKGNTGIASPDLSRFADMGTGKIISMAPSNETHGYTADDLIKYFSGEEISTLLIANPDNFSGNFLDEKDFCSLFEWTSSRGINLIADISVSGFAGTNPAKTWLMKNQMLEQYKGLAVIFDFSRTCGIAGLQICAMGSADTAIHSRISAELPFRALNSFAEFWLQISGKYESDYLNSCRMFIAERQRFYDALRKIDYLKVYPSGSDFFLCRVSEPFTADYLAVTLLEKHDILVDIPGETKGVPEKNLIRISVRNGSDNDTLITALTELGASKMHAD